MSLEKEACPYYLELDFTDFSDDDNSLFFTFRNLSEKEVSKIYLDLNLIDGEGESVFLQGQASFFFEKILLPEEDFSSVLYFDDFLDTEAIPPFTVESCYVSKIEYSDSSVWEDVWGRFSDRN